MKERWLTLILRLTNLIYQKKESELGKHGIDSVINIFVLILFETALAVISIPLYLTTSASKTTAFLEEKGGYAKIAVDYNLRRVLTLTGVGVVFILWVIKLSVILLTPSVAGPLQLYSISELEPADIDHKELVLQDTGMQTARVTDFLPTPEIEGVEKTRGNKYSFFGKGEAGSDVVIFLAGRQNLMYSDKVGEDGTWQLEHTQEDFKLSDGIHSVFVFHYDKDQGIRSQTTDEQYFRIKSSVLERATENVDNLANWSVAVIIIVGILVTFLTI